MYESSSSLPSAHEGQKHFVGYFSLGRVCGPPGLAQAEWLVLSLRDGLKMWLVSG